MSDINDPLQSLGSLDSHGHKMGIIPAEVRGLWAQRREWVRWFLLVIFLVTPWTTVNGIQTILLNVPERTFAIFGVMFWAHDAPLIFFILLSLVFSLALVTAIWGRVWCGWACPQTVFIEGVYRKIEILIEGHYLERRKLRDSELTAKGFLKKTIKWFLFLIVSSLIAHSFIAYFVGAQQLVGMIQGSPAENWSYFLVTSVVTAILLFDFGWFREQFCVIMCPYGRFQSTLLDQKSITVMYDAKRGEPRKGVELSSSSRGDCVACNRCLQVCPTGIDIRNGSQMECIGCTACIDACDEIMEKVKKPKGLIRYGSLASEVEGAPFRWRTLLYGAFVMIGFSGIAWSFTARDSFMVTLLRAKDTPYQVVGEEVINHYKLHLHNQTLMETAFEITLDELATQSGVRVTLPPGKSVVPGGGEKIQHFFVLFPKAFLEGKAEREVFVRVKDLNSQSVKERSLKLLGPL